MADSEQGIGPEEMRAIAAQAMDPCVTNSVVVAAFWEETGGAIDPQAGYDALRAQAEAVREGGLCNAEATLVGQAAALNAVFVDMARRGQAALGRPGYAADRYLRLAMRAQNQCRATLNALMAMAERPSKSAGAPMPIQEIRRIIVRPPNYDAPTDASRDTAEDSGEAAHLPAGIWHERHG